MCNLDIEQSQGLISLDSPGSSSSTNENNSACTNDFDSTHGGAEGDLDFENQSPPKKINEANELDGAVQNKERVASSISDEEQKISEYGVKAPDEFSSSIESKNRP